MPGEQAAHDTYAGRRERPIRPPGVASGALPPTGVRVVGGLLAGQRYLDERCGDGVALASAWRAAASIRAEAGAPARQAVA